MPTVAIVGRPNVGKSTLFNRLVGSRRAIVGDEPGITRDRLYGEAEWRGRHLRIVDTGGILPEDKDFIPAEIFRQAKVALEEADAVIMVVDGRTEMASPDIELARQLIRSGKPLFLAVNKVDTEKQQSLTDEFHRLGIRKLFPISAENARGLDDLLDAVLEILPLHNPQLTTEDTEDAEENARISSGRASRNQGCDHRASQRGQIHVAEPADRRRAFDRLAHSRERRATRSMRSSSTTARRFRFIDTAGIRRKGKTHLMAEKLSVVMARKHLEAADIALLVIDATEGVSQLDAAIAGYAHESGRSMIIIVNKWDLVVSGKERTGRQTKASRMQENKRPADRIAYEERLRDALKFLSYAPILFVSASTGKGTEKIFPTLEEVATERRKRIGTGEMNRFLKHVDFERASVPARQQVRIYYMTQAAVGPPTFVIFTDRKVKLHFAYQRFLENQIRKAFGFLGTPIWIKNRARD